MQGSGLAEMHQHYPASPENSNLRTIPHLRELFDCEVGLSDHTLGVGASVGAVALGATVIEKHFTLDRGAGGVDAAFSMEPAEFRELVVETERAWQALGQVSYGPTKAEKPSLQFRRSIYVTSEIRPGDILTANNVRVIRPGPRAAAEILRSNTRQDGSRPCQAWRSGDMGLAARRRRGALITCPPSLRPPNTTSAS
jgi:sialic acid synthase SpsE